MDTLGKSLPYLATLIGSLILSPGSLIGDQYLDIQPQEFLPGHTVTAVAAGDAKEDTDILGVAVTSPVEGVLLFRRNSGAFIADPDRIISLEVIPRGLLLGDFFSDGYVDLALTTHNTLTLYRGALDFSEDGNDILYFLNTNQRGGRGLHVASMHPNRPGLDFFIGPVVRRWEGDRRVRNLYVRGPESNNNGWIALEDLDKDGFVDAVFGVTNEDKLRIYHGPFPDRLIEPHLVREFVELSAPQSGMVPLIGDMDDDGRMDLVASGRDPDEGVFGIYTWYQNSPVGFSNGASPDRVIRGSTAPLSVALADINDDGLTDIVALERRRGSARLFVFLQRPDRGWASDIEEADQVINLPVPATNHWVLDFTGNGQMDVIVATTNPEGLLIYRNQGE